MPAFWQSLAKTAPWGAGPRPYSAWHQQPQFHRHPAQRHRRHKSWTSMTIAQYKRTRASQVRELHRHQYKLHRTSKVAQSGGRMHFHLASKTTQAVCSKGTTRSPP
ncbi:hypothetical protein V5799_008745 [Amblyomma americanum]|uniref:Uncharacterized protein n=1 Tax=Amblyomma americanum TaxID=6943 RepID=A0AAQ4FDS8_AMBAM